MAFKSNA